MRIALVLLFFIAFHLVIRLSSPASLDNRIGKDALIRPQDGPSLPAPSTDSPPQAASTEAGPPATDTESDDAQPGGPAIRSGEAERPGEQRTSAQTGPKAEDVQTSIQKELTRLGCLSGRPEKRWGPKSRSALRRFVARAKPQGGATPNDALLRTLRGYPVNYCKLCTPGQPACKLGGAPAKRSENEQPAKEATASVADMSYLPPGMSGQQLATAPGDVLSDASNAPTPMQKAMPRRRKVARAVYRPRMAYRSVRKRGFMASSPSGWPRSY